MKITKMVNKNIKVRILNKKEGNNMDFESMKDILNTISDKLPLNDGENKMIKLDINNEDDLEWYNED